MLDSLLFLNYFNSRLCTRGNIDFNTHLPCKRYFNSRLYMRGDVCHSIVLPVVEDISIHASTWEATKNGRRDKQLSLNFNSRLYMRGNPFSVPAFPQLQNFNSRLYMRGNPLAGNGSTGSSHFNSRLYMRGNRFLYFGSGSPGRFQFTPLHERQRSCVCCLSCRVYISIHASTWEATHGATVRGNKRQNFNSRLYMRGNFVSSHGSASHELFQFTPLHERQLA